MRTIPRRLLRDSIAVEAYSGTGAYGPVYAAAVTVRGRVSMTRQLVRNSNGVEVVSEMTLHLHPDDAAPFVPGSRVIIDDRESTVLSVSPHSRPGETVLVGVTCT